MTGEERRARVRRAGSFGAFEYGVLSALAFSAVLCVGLLALLAYPFEPFRVYGEVDIFPAAICPGEDVGVRLESEIQAGWDLRRLEVESVWRPLGAGEDEGPESGGTEEIISPEPLGRGVIKSPIARAAPDESGVYRLYTQTTTYGTFAEGNVFNGFPKTDRVEYVSDDVLVVRNSSAPECENEAENEAENEGDS